MIQEILWKIISSSVYVRIEAVIKQKGVFPGEETLYFNKKATLKETEHYKSFENDNVMLSVFKDA